MHSKRMLEQLGSKIGLTFAFSIVKMFYLNIKVYMFRQTYILK